VEIVVTGKWQRERGITVGIDENNFMGMGRLKKATV